MGGYTFLRWPLYLLFDRALGPIKISLKHNASHAASRFLAAIISAWFSLDILNYQAMAKIDRTNVKQATRNRQDDVANFPGVTLQIADTSDSKYYQTPPSVSAGKTMDLTLLAVTRALDTLVVNIYRCSYPSFPNTASASSTLTAISRYADTVVFALSSSTVVCLQFGAILSRSLPSLIYRNHRGYRMC